MSVQQEVIIPDTDPATISILWTQVMELKMQRPTQTLFHSRSQLRKPATASGSDSLLESTAISSRPPSIRPQQHSDFHHHILAPRHITIDGKRRISLGPFAHFKTETPTSYKALEKLATTNVLLDLGRNREEEIAANYGFMKSKGLCEAEFATYAMETFFRGESRSTAPPEDRLWRTERMLQLVCPPQPNCRWLAPPLIETNVSRSDDYDWDVRPDCAYWISTRGLNGSYVHNVRGVCFAYQNWILCPYITIEFKRDNEAVLAAQTQVLAAGAMALFNRYKLHSQAYQEAADVDTELTDITHYSITFTGSNYIIWRIRPNVLQQTWNGCCMTFLDAGDCTSPLDVKRLVDWINEIHRWGLLRHAPACGADVKRVLNQEGVDTSEIE